MVINKTLNEIDSMIKMKKSFIICTYYLDTYSNFYTAMLNKELKKAIKEELGLDAKVSLENYFDFNTKTWKSNNEDIGSFEDFFV